MKQPRGITDSKKHTSETELAGRSDECCPVDVLFCNGQLQERAEDIGSRDGLDASYCIQTGIQVRKGPALADDMTVEGMTINNTETRATILLCDKSARVTPRSRTLFDYVPF